MKDAKLTDVQLIFALSRANGCDYREPEIVGPKWTWPAGWLTKRLEELAEKGNQP